MTAPYAESPGRWTFLLAQDGHAEMSWTPTPDMANPFGSVHGGIVATVVDEACGAALMPSIEAPSAPTVSLNVEYLRPVLVGATATVISDVVRIGRAMAIVDARVLDEEGTLLARGTCYFQIPRPR
jgi:acyl-coenzyme A thioesterase 13